MAEQRYEPTWESLDQRPVPAWFDEAKFGIFIHWGLYSVPAWGAKGTYAEWYWDALQNPDSATAKFHREHYGPNGTYQDFAPQFTAELFDPELWADLFARSGARYVVLTSKHHEGYCLWPSAESWNWNSVDIGAHRDLCGDLATAVRARGLKMGFYYSLYEWFHPWYLHDMPRFVREHFHPQLKDLVQRYDPSVIFTDGEWGRTSVEWESEALLAWLFNEPACREEVVICDRWGSDCRSRHGGYFTTEYGEVGGGVELAAGRKWEENRGIGASFGFNRNETVDDYQTAYGLICLLVDLVARGGNLLLNIGPTADGRIPVIMQQRLVEIGEWLAVNGEAIFGTQPWRVHAEGPTAPAKDHAAARTQVFTAEDWRFTTRGEVVYAICLSQPEPVARIQSLGRGAGRVTSVRLLGGGAPVGWEQSDEALEVRCPQRWPNAPAVTLEVRLGA